MFLVVLLLNGTSSVRLTNGLIHGICYFIRIHNNMSICITCRTSDCLNQRCFRTKESFFICIQNCHQGNFRNIKTFSQQVDSHQYIKDIQTHVSNNFGTFECINIRMKVFHTNAHFTHVISQIFRHTFRKGRNQNLVLLFNFFIDFCNQIVNLTCYWSYIHNRIKQSCRTDNLFYTLQFMFSLIYIWCCGNKQHLIDLGFKFFKVKWTVI